MADSLESTNAHILCYYCDTEKKPKGFVKVSILLIGNYCRWCCATHFQYREMII